MAWRDEGLLCADVGRLPLAVPPGSALRSRGLARYESSFAFEWRIADEALRGMGISAEAAAKTLAYMSSSMAASTVTALEAAESRRQSADSESYERSKSGDWLRLCCRRLAALGTCWYLR